MTEEEALHLLQVNNVEEVEISFDDLFFEYKSFFISKVPFTKLFNRKLEMLERIFEAKDMFIKSEKEVEELNVELEDLSLGNDLEEVFREFGKNEMKLKLALTQSKTYTQLSHCVRLLIDNYKKNAKYWSLGVRDGVELRQVKMSVEPDVMTVYEEIKKFHSLGLSTSVEINQLADDNLLKQEAFRLSLWSKFEENV